MTGDCYSCYCSCCGRTAVVFGESTDESMVGEQMSPSGGNEKSSDDFGNDGGDDDGDEADKHGNRSCGVALHTQ